MKKIMAGLGAAALGVAASLALAGPAQAHHNDAQLAAGEPGDCGEVTFTTAWALDDHQVANTVLAVLIDGEVTTAPVGEPLTVGPFEADTTILYRVWGGGERDYDDPALDSLDDLLAYLAESETHSPLDPEAPGIAWHYLDVKGCPAEEEEEEEEQEEGAEEKPGEESGEGGEQEELALTGMPTGWIAGGAVALLAVGGGMFVLARRRRVSFTA